MNDSRGEKRPLPPQNSLLEGIKAVLIDAEGVAAPISFVKEVLVPYAEDNLKTFLESHFEDAQKSIDALRSKALADKEAGVEGVDVIPPADADKGEIISAVVKVVLSKIEGTYDSNIRQLLEQVWQNAYKTESIQGELYDDVVPLLRMLASDGIRTFTSSVNSVDSQKTLFGFSNHGDINEYLAGHFEVTSETAEDRFTNIITKLEQRPAEILYLTHSIEDATAAHTAGLKTCIVLREGNEHISDEQLQTVLAIYSLDELWEDDEYDDEIPTKRLHADGDPGLYYGEYSTDGGTNDSAGELGGSYGEPHHDAETGDSEDAA